MAGESQSPETEVHDRDGKSWTSSFQQMLELVRIAAGEEEAVWVVVVRQQDTPRGYPNWVSQPRKQRPGASPMRIHSITSEL